MINARIAIGGLNEISINIIVALCQFMLLKIPCINTFVISFCAQNRILFRVKEFLRRNIFVLIIGVLCAGIVVIFETDHSAFRIVIGLADLVIVVIIAHGNR